MSGASTCQLKDIDRQNGTPKNESNSPLFSRISYNSERYSSTKNQRIENNIACTKTLKTSRSRNFTFKVNFKLKLKRDKEGRFILDKRIIQQEEITLVNT